MLRSHSPSCRSPPSRSRSDRPAEAELAAYEATLPSPLPGPLRAMWQAHATASWRVGDDRQCLRSPGEVLADRAASRNRLQALVAAHAKQGWPVDYLDVIFVDDGANPTLVFDTRQHTDDCYAETSPEGLRSPQWYESLAWMLAVGPCATSSPAAAPVPRAAQLSKASMGSIVPRKRERESASAARACSCLAAEMIGSCDIGY